MRRGFDLADELIDFLADGGLLGRVRREEFEGATPMNESVGVCAGGSFGFSLGGEVLEFVAVNEGVAGRADKKARREVRATLCAGH